MSLYAENGMTCQDYHWSRAWGTLQRKSCSGQSSLYTFFAIEGVLLYGMYLMIQIPHLNFFQILVLLFNLVFLLGCFASSLRRLFEIASAFLLSYANSKLSLIGMLLDIRPVLKLILGTALLGVISYYIPALLFFCLDRRLAFLCQWYLWPFIKISTKNWYPNDEKNLVEYAFKILRLCHGCHLDHYSLVSGDLLKKNLETEADRIAQRVWLKSWRISRPLISGSHKGRSLVENPAKLEGVLSLFLPCHHRVWDWRLNAPSLLISNCPYTRILTVSIWQ